jgi:hypothetical protein
VAPATGGHG